MEYRVGVKPTNIWFASRCRHHLANGTNGTIKNGFPKRSRTSNLWFRRPTPYPVWPWGNKMVRPLRYDLR